MTSSSPSGRTPPPGARGKQRPRVSSCPSYASTLGPEAVELAASAGLHLDPWQAYTLTESLGERPDGKWSAFEVALIVARQNGKGSIIEARELAGLFLLGERLILHSAHEYKTAQEGFLRVKALIDNTDHLRKRVKAVRTANGEQGIELINGNRLRFVARSKGSGRGFTGDCIILDEAYELGAEAMAALMPTLSARPNPQLWYTSSAGMETSAQLNAVRERGLTGTASGLLYLEWSAEKDAAKDSRDAWAEANPALGIRIPEEFVALECEAMPEQEFRRERLSIWSDSRAEAVIDAETWDALADPTSFMVDPVVFAIEMPMSRDSASIAAAGRRLDDLQHLELIDNRAGTAWIADRAVELARRWHGSFVIDPGSPAGALIPQLEEAGVDLILVSARQLAQACGALYDDVTEGKVRHLGQPLLNQALVAGRKRTLGDAWAWDRKDAEVDVSPLVAATLAKYGLDSTPDIDITESVW